MKRIKNPGIPVMVFVIFLLIGLCEFCYPRHKKENAHEYDEGLPDVDMCQVEQIRPVFQRVVKDNNPKEVCHVQDNRSRQDPHDLVTHPDAEGAERRHDQQNPFRSFTALRDPDGKRTGPDHISTGKTVFSGGDKINDPGTHPGVERVNEERRCKGPNGIMGDLKSDEKDNEEENETDFFPVRVEKYFCPEGEFHGKYSTDYR
jgi:hypothetical protein